jgi:hypothetical protein
MKIGDRLPSLAGASAWLNGRPNIDDSRCRAMLVHFWSSGCALCHDAVDDITRWRNHFGARGLLAVGVYQLRPEQTLDAETAEREARRLMRIDYPCALDGERVLTARFNSEYPPGYYLFDGSHVLRHRQMGNANLERIDEIIERILSPHGRNVPT